MYKAILFKKLENKAVQCLACRHYCKIPNNQTGICGVRQNKEGILYLLVYGKASAVNIDPIEKKPLYHFMPGTEIFSLGTVGCNFSCSFCQNWDLSQITKDLKTKLTKEKNPELMEVEVGKFGYELSPEKIINTCKNKNIKSIAYTYNEPSIFFEYYYDTAKLAKKNKIKNILVTNGYSSDESLEKSKNYIDAMNIDLKSFNEDFYKNICKASLKNVLDSIKRTYELGIWLEITTLIIPTKNDSEKELKQIADFIAGIDKNIPWHLSAFYPQYKMNNLPATPHKSLLKAYEIGKKAGLKFIYIGNIPDEKHSSTYCPKCNTLLIERKGFSSKIIDLRENTCRKCSQVIPGIFKEG